MNQELSNRIEAEDALKHLLKEERSGRRPTADSLAGALGTGRDHAVELLAALSSSGLVDWIRDGYELTRHGRNYALQVIRAHRLYETYLADQTGVMDSRWHRLAETEEHRITPEDVRRMDAELGFPRFDPHGDPIPSEAGEMPSLQGVPMISLAAGTVCRVMHVEDEPEKVFERLAARNIAAGAKLEVLERLSTGFRVRMEGDTFDLDEPMAANLTVSILPERERPDASVIRLSAIGEGGCAVVEGLSAACRGPERNRLLDLGIVPGAEIRYAYPGPAGNPVAYLIRGATVALRRQQADRILVRRGASGEARS